MKSFFLLLCVAISAADKRQVNYNGFYNNYNNNFQPFGYPGFGYRETCIADEEVYKAFHHAYDGFASKLYQTITARDANTFTTSPLTIWTTLAAIAEGSDFFTQKELFGLLNLPKELCSRQKFYNVATSRFNPSKYFTNARALVIDDGAHVNPQWYDVIATSRLLEVIPAPIRFDAATTYDIIKKIAAPKTEKIDLSGTSVLLNAFDYNGVWNTAFTDAVLEHAPFHNAAGEKVGYVDLLRVVRRVRIGNVKSIGLKVLELTVGEKDEYVVWFGLPDDNNVNNAVKGFNKEIILETIEALKDSEVPVDIAIPRFSVESEFELKDILREMGILPNLWSSPGSTRFISTPPARPSSYIQRTSFGVNNKGISQPSFEYPVYRHASTEGLYWSEFIADRPFTYIVLDKETHTILLGGVFAQPTYSLDQVVPELPAPVPVDPVEVFPVPEVSPVPEASPVPQGRSLETVIIPVPEVQQLEAIPLAPEAKAADVEVVPESAAASTASTAAVTNAEKAE